MTEETTNTYCVKIGDLTYNGTEIVRKVKYPVLPQEVLDIMNPSDTKILMSIIVNDKVVSEIYLTRPILENYVTEKGATTIMDLRFPIELLMSMLKKL